MRDAFCWLHPCYEGFFYFFIKPDRKYLESLHFTDFLGIKHVPGEVSISLAINFKGNRIIEMTEQVFDFHFSNPPFSLRLAQLMLYIFRFLLIASYAVTLLIKF